MVILDASAVLAVLFEEPGADVVEGHLSAAVICAPNVTEVVTRLVDKGQTLDEAVSQFSALGLSVASLDEGLAIRAAAFRAATSKRGLSLGDRACLALAEREKLPAVTGDRDWRNLNLAVEIRLIR
ncbi:MAG: type II toxin-antitoxin system VapC family toxin [Alphaproteobacteria bacterium]|nr:type II toxin-antitoxin system VapC family toxin [Alphaproteobacteria bacterium]